MIVYGSSGSTRLARARARRGRRPRRARELGERQVAARRLDGDHVLELGQRSRTCSILASWVSFSQMTARAPELPSTHSHSRGELVG